MRVCAALLLFLGLLFHQRAFISALTVHKVTVGGTITVQCLVTLAVNYKRIFCKNGCNNEDVLVETSEKYACKGRFCIAYGGWRHMVVNITNVTRSDAGPYQCVAERSGKNTIQTFRIEVTNTKPTFSTTETTYPGSTTTASSAESPRPDKHHTSSEPIFLLLLLVPVAVVLLIGSVLIYRRKKKSRNNNGTTGNSEDVLYENCRAPASEPADSTYQALSADTRDHSHIYSSLNTQPSSH